MAKFLDRLAARLGYAPRQPQRRTFSAAAMGRLYGGWVTAPMSIDRELRQGLRAVRSRSRDLSVNNAHGRRFLNMGKINVLGPDGITMQPRLKRPDGTLDEDANRILDEGWAEWGRRGNCTVCGTMSWRAVERLDLEAAARDGEFLLRKVRGFPNAFGFALQPIDVDHLDEDYNAELPGGREVRMGVELDRWKRPIAFHLLTRHPGENGVSQSPRRRERIGADEIVHGFVRERAGQTRGLPWGIAAMTRLKMLDGYEEAALVAARVGAAKGGFYVEDDPDAYETADLDEEGNPLPNADSDGNLLQEAEAGHFERLPAGVKFEAYDPTYPHDQFGDFTKAALRGASAGMNVSYNSLSWDLEGVNFSSMRSGLIEERDGWRVLQRWFYEDHHDQVYRDWLRSGLLHGAIDLPAARFDEAARPIWRPRGWAWVDPLKDQQAVDLGLKNKLRTRRSVVAETGRDIEDVFREIAEEEALARKHGISLAAPSSSSPAKAAAGAGEDAEDGDQEDDEEDK